MKILSTLLTAVAVSSAAFALTPAVSVSLSQAGPAKAGKPIKVNVHITVPSGYHIYGPKDESGIPTNIVLSGPNGFKASVLYPKTSSFKNLDGTTAAVFVGDTTIPVVVTTPKGFKGKPTLKFKVTTQACNDRTCLPPSTADLTVTVK
jgi:DsbC/DsbD-like thiol-disulfide interchange protein